MNPIKDLKSFNQPNDEKGIYNAMNIVFKFVKDYEWLIFFDLMIGYQISSLQRL